MKALGPGREIEVNRWPAPLPLRFGDRIVLCSDGLHDLVDDDELAQRVAGGTPADACWTLVDLARERGAPDNVSVVVLAYDAPAS